MESQGHPRDGQRLGARSPRRNECRAAKARSPFSPAAATSPVSIRPSARSRSARCAKAIASSASAAVGPDSSTTSASEGRQLRERASLSEAIVNRAGRTGGTFLHTSRTRPSHLPRERVPRAPQRLRPADQRRHEGRAQEPRAHRRRRADPDRRRRHAQLRQAPARRRRERRRAFRRRWTTTSTARTTASASARA